MVLIELQTVFDTVNHDILIKKVEFTEYSEEATI